MEKINRTDAERHLAHVFPDGPWAEGNRHRINWASLSFEVGDGA